MTNEILKEVENKTLKPKQAYNKIYKTKTPVHTHHRAHFIKMKIIIPEERGVSTFLSILFALPIPILFIRPFLRIAYNKAGQDFGGIELKDIHKMISTRGIRISVRSNDGVIVKIKTI